MLDPADHFAQESRRTELESLLTPATIGALATSVDIEGMRLIESAIASFVAGVDAAAIICAHASCERDLLAELDHWQQRSMLPEPPGDFDRWGLGRILDHTGNSLPIGLLEELSKLNERRKILYHYKTPSPDTGLLGAVYEYTTTVGLESAKSEYIRKYNRAPDPKETLEEVTQLVLRAWAVEAIATAFALRNWLYA